MTKRIFIQLDSDPQPSSFDSVVAIDAGVDHLLRYGDVQVTSVEPLVHGAMFTRGPGDLCNTAIFIGGSDVTVGELLLQQVTSCFFGPMRVSVMLDANGANTTAAAAVLSAAKHVELNNATATVLAATGPVGHRIVRLLANENAKIRVGSRSQARAERVCQLVAEKVDGGVLTSCATSTPSEIADAIRDSDVVFTAGALGVELLSADAREQCSSLKVAIDLNAIPPLGIGGIEVTDKAVERGGTICYVAIGVGGTKMKIHKAAVRKLFDANDHVLDAEEIFAIGRELLAQ